MGTLYGGIAHVPLSAMVLVCELAGSYDLLVPLMLAEGIAFIALRKRSLYHAQLPSRRRSPAHRDDSGLHTPVVATGPPPPDPPRPEPLSASTTPTPPDPKPPLSEGPLE